MKPTLAKKIAKVFWIAVVVMVIISMTVFTFGSALFF